MCLLNHTFLENLEELLVQQTKLEIFMSLNTLHRYCVKTLAPIIFGSIKHFVISLTKVVP